MAPLLDYNLTREIWLATNETPMPRDHFLRHETVKEFQSLTTWHSQILAGDNATKPNFELN